MVHVKPAEVQSPPESSKLGKLIDGFDDEPPHFDHVKVTKMTPKLAPPPPLLTSTPLEREDVSASTDLTSISPHPSSWRVFNGIRLEFMTKRLEVRYLEH
ncbi:hypothetical protein TNCV_4990921 [Trichonephila clavipes]|nr:hypothetical protein TNCV_4990921 [Trichonephila clavipes]